MKPVPSTAILIVLAAALGTLGAQETRSTNEGVYNQAQAVRGRELYADKCSNCHARALTGDGENGPVAGDKFKGEWEGETVLALFDRVRNTMPYKTPGTLSRQETADLVAFLLYFNGAPAGQAELSTRAEMIGSIKIEWPKR